MTVSLNEAIARLHGPSSASERPHIQPPHKTAHSARRRWATNRSAAGGCELKGFQQPSSGGGIEVLELEFNTIARGRDLIYQAVLSFQDLKTGEE